MEPIIEDPIRDKMDLLDMVGMASSSQREFEGDETYLAFDYDVNQLPDKIRMYVEIGGYKAEFLIPNVEAVRVGK